MATPPILPLFVDDFLGDTQHLSCEENGAYMLLLFAAWRSPDCSLPDDDRKLARICRLSVRKWKSVRHALDEFWPVENGRIRHAGRCTGPKERKAIPIAVAREVIERDGERCVYCDDREGPFHFDHVLPWSRGGLDTTDNLVRACARCNLEKGDRTPDEMGWVIT